MRLDGKDLLERTPVVLICFVREFEVNFDSVVKVST